jgi:hypothetical protein
MQLERMSAIHAPLHLVLDQTRTRIALLVMMTLGTTDS